MTNQSNSSMGSTCSKTALVHNLQTVVSHLTYCVEQAVSNGHPGTPQAATQARLAAARCLQDGDKAQAEWYFALALAAVRADKLTWSEELLRSLHDLFLIRFETGNLEQVLPLVEEMIPHLDRCESENGRPRLGTADLLHLKSYMLCVQRKYDDAIVALQGCLAIRKKHLDAGNALVEQNALTLEHLKKKESA